MVNEIYIEDFLNKFDYDIRKSRNGRWIDQKCTPDVVNLIADCVLNFYKNHDINDFFSAKNIWDLDYSNNIINLYFDKPILTDKGASNEYDKFFAQPLELLAYSEILKKEKRGNRNFYVVNNYNLLEFISLDDKKAFHFLRLYIEKVLKDSDFFEYVEDFFYEQNKESYDNLKDNFSTFTIKNTKINGVTESNRIFIKVINTLSCFYKKLGTSHGRISKEIISYSTILYNQKNFRDIYVDKPKGITRKEWKKQVDEAPSDNIDFNKSAKVITYLHRFNYNFRKNCTEVCVGKYKGPGTQMHHIFPRTSFPEISYFYENIVALSPSQHYLCAHPDNNTNRINEEYRKVILKEKAKRIKENILNPNVETIFCFDNFIEVLNDGFNKDFETENINYSETKSIINECYSDM